MNKSFGFFTFSGLTVMLTACVGGASDPVGSEVLYPYSTSYINGETQNTLGGVAIRSNGTSGELQMITLSGKKDHVTRATLVSDGTYALLDDNGFDDAAKITDGHSSLSLRPIASNYTSSKIFDQYYTIDGITYDSVGVLGVVTLPMDLPTGGSTTYRGRSDAIIITADQGFSLQGQSMVVADFAGIGSVDVTIDSFVATDMMTGSTTAAPVDTITVSNMVISGNRFSGGTVATLQNGTSVFVTGANTTTASEGVFFGYDPELPGPDEVGGMILMQGDDGIVIGSFLAD